DFPLDLYDPVYGQPLPALTRTTTYDDENLKSYAFFLQNQIALTERLTAHVGPRLERFEQRYDNRPTPAGSCAPAHNVVSPRLERFEQRYENKLTPAGSWDQAHNAVSPRFGLIYDLTEELAVYANTSRSFKPNRGADRSSQAFEPEKGIAHEVGIKYELPEHD